MPTTMLDGDSNRKLDKLNRITALLREFSAQPVAKPDGLE